MGACSSKIRTLQYVTIVPLNIMDEKYITNVYITNMTPLSSVRNLHNAEKLNPSKIQIIPSNTIIYKDVVIQCCSEPVHLRYFMEINRIRYDVQIDCNITESDIMKRMQKN
jgi:hypothetical protein